MEITIVIVVLVVLILFLLAFMLFRTLTFARPLGEVEPAELLEVDENEVASQIARAVQFETVTVHPEGATSYQPFAELHAHLKQAYPRVHAELDWRVINEHSLLYTWKGRNAELAPVVFMGHMDVVPVEAEALTEWEHPPFAGEIADGFVWGRGTQDDNMQVIGVLEAAERLLKAGFQPERTICLAFGHDEETGGKEGAKMIAEYLEEQGLRPAAVLDEGMAVVEGLLPGIDTPFGLVGIAEKGFLTLQLTVDAAPGHSSTPPSETAIGILSKALAFLEASPMPAKLDSAQMLFKGLGPVLPFKMQLALANLWLFGGTVRKMLEKTPATNALIRTTTAITIVQAGVKDNILPSKATAKVNFRLLPGDTIAGVCERVRKIIDDERVKFEPVQKFVSEPSTFSRTDSEAFRALELTIRQVFDGIPVAPMLVLGGTDSRYYHPVCDSVYRFSPLTFTSDDMKRVHGTNERVRVESLGKMVQFYALLMKRWGGEGL